MIGNKPTLRDVAKKAGVSLGTASNVLNNKAKTSAEAKARVLEAAESLGYKPLTVLTETSAPNFFVGAIGKIDDGQSMNTNPFYSYALSGIERECQRHHMSLMFANIEVDRMNRPINLPPLLFDNQVNGILMVGTFLQDTIRLIGNKINKPLVLLDAYAPESQFDSVLTDNVSGAYHAVEFLIQRGHNKIGLVGSQSHGYPSIRERRKGYLRALKHYRIDTSYIEESPLTRDGGFEGARKLLTRAPEISAIFACNDEVASGIYQAARDLGRRIPGDLSVIGFDDIDLAQQLNPPLTTMRVDKTLMGMLAVRMLKERADHPNNPAMTMLLGTQMISRTSVRTLRL